MPYDGADAAKTVLIIDDDPVVREYLRTRLTAAGYGCRTESGGHEGLQALRESRFDLILLDLQMPGLDGFRVLSRLRERPNLARTPVMVLSARKDHGGVREALALGARDYLTKPFHEAALLQRVRRLAA